MHISHSNHNFFPSYLFSLQLCLQKTKIPKICLTLAIIGLSFFLMSCSSTSNIITKETWVECWEWCGEGDKLKAVDPCFCYCKDGSKFKYAGSMRDTEPPGFFY